MCNDRQLIEIISAKWRRINVGGNENNQYRKKLEMSENEEMAKYQSENENNNQWRKKKYVIGINGENK
jgi:hypothetical protein